MKRGQRTPDGDATLRAALHRQAEACRNLGSPFTARLCDLLAARLRSGGAVADALFAWPGDPTAAGDAVPLRLTGALHALVLDGRCRALSAVYPPHDAASGDDALWSALEQALTEHVGVILDWLKGPPQTNEPGRAAALLPGFLTVAALTGRPLVLSEIGASAGLNLLWDRFHTRLGARDWGDPAAPVRLRPRWAGPPPPAAAVTVHARAGCDVAPLDPALPADRLRLLSYIWPDQAERLARTRAALEIARSERVPVDRADALDWLERRLTKAPTATAHVVYHSITWQYLSERARDRARALLAAAGSRATRRAPLAWLRLEHDGRQPGAALTLTLWPPGAERQIARADFHGRWVDWTGWKEGG